MIFWSFFLSPHFKWIEEDDDDDDDDDDDEEEI